MATAAPAPDASTCIAAALSCWSPRNCAAPCSRAASTRPCCARGQAEGYARALPASEGRPPFVVVVDVGRRIELYSEFSRSGATYTPFPDPRSHRIALADLARHDVLERLRRVWSDPLSLDPRARPRASRARSPRASPNSRAVSKRHGTRPNSSRNSSCAACSPCSPKTSACCPQTRSATC
jgi:hypothetical protein